MVRRDAVDGSSSDWPRGVYSTEQVRGFDRHAIDELGIAGFELMTRAGRAALELVQASWPDARSLSIYCGAGNNAGDGYVLAALAAEAGLTANILAVADPAKLTGDAAKAHALARDAGIEIRPFAEPRGSAVGSREGRASPPDRGRSPADRRGRGAPPPDLIVDALLGTGLGRDLDGVFAAAVEAINRSAAPVLALDVPSGLDSDTGAVRGTAVSADATITFVGLKTGLYLGLGPDRCGRVAFADLGLGAAADGETAADRNAAADGEAASDREVVPRLHRLDPADRAQLLRPRSRMSHKGLNGKVLVVGGAAGMGGAARLAAEGALRAGAGLVYAAVDPASVGAVMAGRPEIQCRGVERIDDCTDWLAAADAVVLGPGLGRGDWGRALASAVLSSDRTLVVDADGLNLLAEHPQKRGRWAMTPHPGEAARLLSCSTNDVQAARDRAVSRLAHDYGAVAVLKGASSLIAAPDADGSTPIAVCGYGNPGMATGGMGDVLSGVVGALIAQLGFSRQAVELGVLIHALAGDDAADGGERGLAASDLMAHIRRRVNPV